MSNILGYISPHQYLLWDNNITGAIVTGTELLEHAQVWNVSSERWFIVVLWFIRSTTEHSNSLGPFMFEKGEDPPPPQKKIKKRCQEPNPNVIC